MGAITDQNIKDIYQYGVLVNSNEISKKEAIDRLAESKMNRKSATMYMTCITALLSGELYGSTTNEKSIDYFLKHIKTDFGENALNTALQSLRSHLEYQEGRNNLPGLWRIHDWYSQQ